VTSDGCRTKAAYADFSHLNILMQIHCATHSYASCLPGLHHFAAWNLQISGLALIAEKIPEPQD
jgi:hypothetical protein